MDGKVSKIQIQIQIQSSSSSSSSSRRVISIHPYVPERPTERARRASSKHPSAVDSIRLIQSTQRRRRRPRLTSTRSTTDAFSRTLVLFLFFFLDCPFFIVLCMYCIHILYTYITIYKTYMYVCVKGGRAKPRSIDRSGRGGRPSGWVILRFMNRRSSSSCVARAKRRARHNATDSDASIESQPSSCRTERRCEERRERRRERRVRERR